MKATDDLYQLIKCLTASEKRYFKIFSKRHVVGELNKYEILFDGFDAHADDKLYDEEYVKLKLKNVKLSKNFADEKKNLHEMVMKAMRSFHAGVSIDNQLNELLADEDFYKDKRLNQLRRKAIDKGKEIAEKYERYNILLTLLEREGMMLLEINQDKLKELGNTIGQEKKTLLDKISIIMQLKDINDWFFIQYRIYAGQVPEDFWRVAEKKMADPVFKAYQKGLCFTGDIFYNKIWALYYMLKGDYINYNEYHSAIYQQFEVQYPHQKVSNPIGYRTAMYNYLHSLNMIGGYDKMKSLIEYAEQLPAVNEDEAGEDFQNIALFKQLYYLNTSQYDKAVSMVGEINAGIKRHRKKVNKARELTMLSNIAISYMMLGQWSEVVDYTEQIICDKTDARQDIKYEARLHQLIARYELDQYDQLSYQIRNTQRWIDSKNALSISYNNALKLLTALMRDGKSRLKAMRIDLDKQMPEYKGYPSVQVWLYGRIKNISMQEAAKETEL